MNVSSFTDAAGEAFATDFSDHFDELATVWPAIGDLRSLSTLAALARGLARTDARPDLRYWLNEYRVSETATPTEAEVLRNAAEDVGFEVHGGVHLQSLSVRLKQGDLTAFSEAVLRARPSGDSVSWTVTLTSQKDIFVPSGPATMEVESAAQFYARAHHLFRARQYDLAIAHWLQVARVHPDMGEVYFDIGLAFERKGMVACAAEYYSKALDLEPFLRGDGKRPEGGEMRVSNEQEVLR
jgi:tetratricopeptide (TPR) repeat protein